MSGFARDILGMGGLRVRFIVFLEHCVEVRAAVDDGSIRLADLVGFSGDGGFRGDAVNEILGGFQLLPGLAELHAQMGAGGFGVVFSAVADEDRTFE